MGGGLPDLSFEAAARARGRFRIAGVDEVGRGPLAGPVTAAAVVLDPGRVPDGLNDSKALRAIVREGLCSELYGLAEVSVGHATVEEIDRLNILRASHLAMARAVAGLSLPPDHLLIDGRLIPDGLPCGAEGIIGGDARSCSIAAASIVAKVCRDRIMVDLAQKYPGYGWETNKGYGTPQHHRGLRELGATPHHRRTFRPVRNILYQGVSASL